MSDNEEEPVVKPPPKEEPGKRIFLSHANTKEGLALFKQIWNLETCREPELAAHSFIGTVKSNETNYNGQFQEPPEGIEIVDF